MQERRRVVVEIEAHQLPGSELVVDRFDFGVTEIEAIGIGFREQSMFKDTGYGPIEIYGLGLHRV